MKSPFFGFSQVTKVYFWPGNGSAHTAKMMNGFTLIPQKFHRAYIAIARMCLRGASIRRSRQVQAKQSPQRSEGDSDSPTLRSLRA